MASIIAATPVLDRLAGPHYDSAVGEAHVRSITLRKTMSIGVAAVALSTTIACSPNTPAASTETTASSDAAVKKNEEWRAKHESDYRRDWVSIAGLHFLEPGSQSVGSAPSNAIVVADLPPTIGRLVLKDMTVRFEPEPGVNVRIKDQTVTAPMDLKDDLHPPADELVVGDVRMVIHGSGDRLSLRVRNPNGELAKGFLGFSWFPIDAKHRTTGRFIKDPEPRKMAVLNTFGDMDTYNTEGVIEFELYGQTLRLRPFTTRPKRFYIVFKDQSAGQETYEAARFLYADLQDDGTTVLDFNEAYNPPCAFNPYTTCPIPLKENNLPIKVLAGEKAYPVHVALPTTSE
jgi:uncharacterized protein (DUF1684 family)